jgi:hypothetical protein
MPEAQEGLQAGTLSAAATRSIRTDADHGLAITRDAAPNFRADPEAADEPLPPGRVSISSRDGNPAPHALQATRRAREKRLLLLPPRQARQPPRTRE